MPIPLLSTNRLILRPLSTADSKAIFALRSDPEINRYLGRKPSNTVEEATAFIQQIIDNQALYWAITLREKDLVIGTICLFGFSDDNKTCEIGYELLPPYQGKGMVNEAATRVIDYAFQTVHIERILAWFHRDNARTIRSLERLSFSLSNETDKENPELLCYALAGPGSGLE